MLGRISVTPDERPEEVIRRSLRRWWAVATAGLIWLIYFNPGGTPEAHTQINMPLYVPILVTIGGVVAGHLFGYKLGIAPFFCGVYMFHRPEPTPLEKFRQELSKLQIHWRRLHIWEPVQIAESGAYRLIIDHKGYPALESTDRQLGQGTQTSLYQPEDLERAMSLTGATDEDVRETIKRCWHGWHPRIVGYWNYSASVLFEWRMRVWRMFGG